MNDKKKRMLFIIVVIVVVLCISSTALAAGTVNYSKGFSGTYATYAYTTSISSSLTDANSQCYFVSGANSYTTGYTSRLMAQKVSLLGDLGDWYCHASIHNNSTNTVTMSYSNIYGYTSNGKLGFKNIDAPGYYLVVTGTVTIN